MFSNNVCIPPRPRLLKQAFSADLDLLNLLPTVCTVNLNDLQVLFDVAGCSPDVVRTPQATSPSGASSSFITYVMRFLLQ